MEWSMLLVAAVLAAASVFTVHALRRHPDATAALALDRRTAERRAPRDAGADDGATAAPGEELPTEHQRPN